MKAPSLDAIRRFKEQQELKKREDEERKIKEKLNTLEHRASQGDKKAKQNLKRFEQTKSEANKSSASVEPKPNAVKRSHDTSKSQQHVVIPKLKKVVTDFDELMKLARNNNNELRKDEPKPLSPPPKPQSQPPIVSNRTSTKERCERKPPSWSDVEPKHTKQPKFPTGSKKHNLTTSVATSNYQPLQQVRREPIRELPRRGRMQPSEVSRFARFQDQHRADDLEDEYEQDDFVVDDDEDDAQEELRQTLRSVFRYDRRRCDLREQELDREYKAIGHVSTFEDLEREERRASRLAALEDARAQREEDERKRLKRLKQKRN